MDYLKRLDSTISKVENLLEKGKRKLKIKNKLKRKIPLILKTKRKRGVINIISNQLATQKMRNGEFGGKNTLNFDSIHNDNFGENGSQENNKVAYSERKNLQEINKMSDDGNSRSIQNIEKEPTSMKYKIDNSYLKQEECQSFNNTKDKDKNSQNLDNENDWEASLTNNSMDNHSNSNFKTQEGSKSPESVQFNEPITIIQVENMNFTTDSNLSSLSAVTSNENSNEIKNDPEIRAEKGSNIKKSKYSKLPRIRTLLDKKKNNSSTNCNLTEAHSVETIENTNEKNSIDSDKIGEVNSLNDLRSETPIENDNRNEHSKVEDKKVLDQEKDIKDKENNNQELHVLDKEKDKEDKVNNNQDLYELDNEKDREDKTNIENNNQNISGLDNEKDREDKMKIENDTETLSNTGNNNQDVTNIRDTNENIIFDEKNRLENDQADKSFAENIRLENNISSDYEKNKKIESVSEILPKNIDLQTNMLEVEKLTRKEKDTKSRSLPILDNEIKLNNNVSTKMNDIFQESSNSVILRSNCFKFLKMNEALIITKSETHGNPLQIKIRNTNNDYSLIKIQIVSENFDPDDKTKIENENIRIYEINNLEQNIKKNDENIKRRYLREDSNEDYFTRYKKVSTCFSNLKEEFNKVIAKEDRKNKKVNQIDKIHQNIKANKSRVIKSKLVDCRSESQEFNNSAGQKNPSNNCVREVEGLTAECQVQNSSNKNNKNQEDKDSENIKTRSKLKEYNDLNSINTHIKNEMIENINLNFKASSYEKQNFINSIENADFSVYFKELFDNLNENQLSVEKQEIFTKILEIISKGDLEMDQRFVKMLELIINKLGSSSDPFTCKVCVDISLCVNYVKDFIELKKIAEKLMKR